MKILSIDVGIKNLALCILEINNNTYNIIKWEIINLCGSLPTCKENIKKKSSIVTCNKNVKYTKNNKYYCKSCAKKTNYIIPSNDLNSIYKKRIKIDDLKKIATDYNVEIDNKCKKQDIVNILKEFINIKCLETTKEISAAELSLIDIGISIRNCLDNSDYLNVDKILIENQISPLANRMKTIQGMIAQFFIMHKKEDIEFISASNKLKYFIKNEKTTYNERKKLSIEVTKDILVCDNNHWYDYLCNSNKKDDLADCFLQGLWYILHKNLANTKYKSIGIKAL